MSTCAELLAAMAFTPDELLAELAELEQRSAVAALAIRRMEVAGAFGGTGPVNTAAWLRHHARMSEESARALVRRGRFLDRFTAVGDAAVAHELSADQLAVMQRLHKPKFEALLDEHQAVMVGHLATLDVAGTQDACTLWRQRAEAIVKETEPPEEPERSLTMNRAGDGALLGRFTLDDAAATELEKAVANAVTYEGAEDQRTMAQRQGDALFDIAAHFNKNHEGEGTPRHLPNVTLSADAGTLSDTPVAVNDDTDRVMSSSCIDTYLCDCKVHGVLRDANAAPVGFGRSQYSIPRTLFRQVAARDGGCRFPGCDRKVRFTDAHHIKYWRHFGETEYENLVLLCSRHHHYVHLLDLHLKLLPNADLHVTWSDGRERVSHPRGAPPRIPF